MWLCQIFDDDLSELCEQLSDAANRCGRLLQQNTTVDDDYIRARLTTIEDEMHVLLKLSADRVTALEDALPIATHFAVTQRDLRAWLDEVDVEVQSILVPQTANEQQIREVVEEAKVHFRLLCIRKVFSELRCLATGSSTGLDTRGRSLCSKSEA